MYTMHMADALFESDAAAPEGSISEGTYEQVLFALQYDQGVAENVFARRAKHDLRSFLNRDVKLLVSGEEISPIWVDQQTVVIDGSMISKEQPVVGIRSLCGRLLEGVVLRLAASIQNSALDDQTVLLIGALWVRVQDLGGNQHSFSLKQKWGVRG